MDTLARICETLNCEITDVIELVPDEPASTYAGKPVKLGKEKFDTAITAVRSDLYVPN